MKPVKVVVTVIGSCVAITVLAGLIGKVRYSSTGNSIKLALDEYKTIGLVTNADDFSERTNDIDNAWPDIAKLIARPTDNGRQRFAFRSELAIDFINVANRSDLPTLKKYLSVNRATLESIGQALQSKSKTQFAHDYSADNLRSFGPSIALRDIAREFCLTALESAMENDGKKMLLSLGLAVRITNDLLNSGDWQDLSSAITVRTTIASTTMRIIEVAPQLRPALENYFDQESRFLTVDSRKIIQTQFLLQLSIERFYDIPSMDHSRLPFPLDQLSSNTEVDKTDQREPGSVKHGDYIPNSTTVRGYMLTRLHAWKPLAKEAHDSQSRDFIPSDSSLKAIYDPPLGANTSLAILKGIGMAGQTPEYNRMKIARNRQQDQANRIVWRLLDEFEKTGRYPSTLEPLALPTDSFECVGGLEYTSDSKGFALRSKGAPDSGIPYFRLSYPLARTLTASSLEFSASRVKGFTNGKLTRDGADAKEPTARPMAGPSVPRF